MTEQKKTFTCNAPLAQKKGYCSRGAGEGTDHPGEGHCFLHGGGESTEAARKHAPFLEAQARGLAHQDLESLYEMSNKGLVLARALAVQRLINASTLSTKEASDLTIAIKRIDQVLKAIGFETEDDPDAAPNTGGVDPLTAELERLNALER